MQITRQADYALRTILYLSQLEPTQRAATRVIAEEKRIPLSFLAKIISQLSIAGLINTSRGARGGVSLARLPGDISILEVVEAIDGPIKLNECTINKDTCPFGDDCLLRPMWCEIRKVLIDRLSNMSFEQFVSNESTPQSN